VSVSAWRPISRAGGTGPSKMNGDGLSQPANALSFALVRTQRTNKVRQGRTIWRGRRERRNRRKLDLGAEGGNDARDGPSG